MFRTRYIKTLILAAAAVAAACTSDPADPVNPEPDYDAEPASLTIDISIADLGIAVETRGGESAGAGAGASTGAGAGEDTPTPTSTPTFPTTPSSALDSKIANQLDPDYKGVMSDEAAFIDGREMSCMTVILVHRRSNRIVGIRRIPDMSCPSKDKVGQTDPNNVNALYDEDGKVVTFDTSGKPSNGATHARITFDYENPFHVVTQEMVDKLVEKATTEEEKNAIRAANAPYIGESAERMVRGEYTIMVVANYDHSVTTSSLPGSDNQTLNVNRVLSDIADKFHEPKNMAEGIGNFNPGYEYFYDIRFLMNRTLKRDNNLNDVFDVVKYSIDGDRTPLMPYIRPAVHQTLSVAKEFYLESGDNHIDLELLRISSRTRVEVKNNSATPLKVHSLEFSPNYTQSTIYLFRRNKVNRDYGELATTTGRYTDVYYTDHDGKGAPMVGYTGIKNLVNGAPSYGAIVPFLPDWDSDNDNVADGVKVEPKAKRCIFDALMYESNVNYKDEDEPADLDSYTYTIDVSYPEVTNYRTTDKNKLDPQKNITENVDYIDRYEYAKNEAPQYLTGFTDNESLYNTIQSSNTKYFLIQGVGSQMFLFEKDDGRICAGAETVDLEAFDITSYLWTMEVTQGATGDLSCTLKNVKSGKYMGAIPKETHGITSVSEEQKQPFSLSTAPKDGAYNVAFATSYDGTPYYLNVWGGGENYDGDLGGWPADPATDTNSQFYLYPVKLVKVPVHEGTPRITKTVKLTTFSDETAIVEDVHEIQRNDFVRILVEVSYNPDKSDFEFNVQPWNKDKGGDVNFN